MKILGITVEYNPFHNGHKYHFEKSMEMTGAEYSVAIMSGNFTQRGEAAVLDKWTRSRLAVENGIDLVIELPFVFACNIGGKFASGAVDILKSIGVTDIVFGSESGDIRALETLVSDMNERAEDIDFVRQQEMKSGYSFAKAFQIAAEKVLGSEKAALMLEPNNILALEYLKRIEYWNKNGHFIEPYALKRYGSGYHTSNEHTGFAGASVLRKMLGRDSIDYNELQKYVSDNVAKELLYAEKPQKSEERAFLLLKGEIVKNSSSNLSKIYRMGEGLENKFKKEIIKAKSMEEFISSIVSRRYTEAAIRRLIVYILMGLKMQQLPEQLYARVLAVGSKGRKLLKTMKKQELSSIPIITNINKELDLCETVKETLEYDLLASDIYNILKGRSLYEFSDKVKTPYIEINDRK